MEISKEIPQQEMQVEFLRRWEMMSVSRRALINKKRSDNSSNKTMSRPLQGAMPYRIGNDFAQYIGKIAKTMLRHYR